MTPDNYRPIRPIRARNAVTGEEVPITPELLKTLHKEATRPLTEEEQEEALAFKLKLAEDTAQRYQDRIHSPKYHQIQEHAQRQTEALQRAEAALTTLDTTCVPGQFNVLLAALCELNPDFLLTPETNLGDLFRAVIESRPTWFGTSQITVDKFFAALREKEVPSRQYFTTRDQVRFDEAHPNQTNGYTLAELLTWLHPECAKSLSFPVHTGQEWTALLQHAGDAKIQRNFTGNEQAGTLRHQRSRASFYTETILLAEERDAGYSIDLLIRISSDMSLDLPNG